VRPLNIFGKNKQGKPVPGYVADPEEYAEQGPVPALLRSFYAYGKRIFLLLFPAGFALSFTPFYFFAAAALLSVLISCYFISRFAELLDTRLKFFTYMAIPPFCTSAGFAFGLLMAARIAETAQK
jgi:hypothetical protein